MPDLPGGFAPITQQRIYVTCPGGTVTGGPELLHQLVGLLASSGRDAHIVYTPLGRRWKTPSEYERYACPVADAIPDEQDVAVIVPEVSTYLLLPFRRARPVVWWLSVDNYHGSFENLPRLVALAQRLFRGRISTGTTHLFQCAYARDYVAARFGSSGAMLSDYLAAEYLAGMSTRPRRDVVAYNPKKGRAQTARLIRALPSIDFLPLQGMTRIQLREALETCKVYIDFGEHPGKDRLPREAAARGAIVIVGQRGAAANEEDVPLPADYKLDPRAAPHQIGRLIRDCFGHFERHAKHQEPYRAAIRREPLVFQSQMKRVFAIDKSASGTFHSEADPRRLAVQT